MPAGRPTKFTPEIALALLSLLRLGHSLRAACESCRLSPRTLRSWIAKAKESPDEYPELAEFLPLYMEAVGTGIIAIETRVLQDSKQSGELGLKVLERRRWKDWGGQGWRLAQVRKEMQEMRDELAEIKSLLSGRTGNEA